MNVLSISHSILQKNAPHAGGNTYAYYMEQIANEPDMALHVVCMGLPSDIKKADFKKFNATGTLLMRKGGLWLNLRRIFWDVYGELTNAQCINSYFKFHSYVRELRRLKKCGYAPDIIILEWAECVALSSECRRIFPNAKILGSEHDVLFLSYERRTMNALGKVQRWNLQRKAQKIKKVELASVNACDVVMPHNWKDARLLLKNGIPQEKIFPIVAFYRNMISLNHNAQNHDIVFWGAMSRPENYEAAIWFIDFVMPKLQDLDVRFVVIGSNPHSSLVKKASGKVIVTGFVDNPDDYFEKSMCMAVPLKVGAGIKVKVLEAMSSGIPVLTNDIGIEGIPAENNVHYFHCNTAEDYEKSIRGLISNEYNAEEMTKQERSFIREQFDIQASGREYIRLLHRLAD